jgi:prepilin-type N-terminal cleavage/methylation domain-containing protein
MRSDLDAGAREASGAGRQKHDLTPCGFTLLELVVVIAVIGILVAAVTPSVVQQIMDSRIAETRLEAQSLYEGMVGKPAEGRFGFVGDLGRLPTSFTELAQPGSLPAFTTSTTRAVGMGWRGPYVNIGTTANDYLTDAFGRAYTGASSGQVRSAGPDGVAGNADDIIYPPAAPVIGGTVTATVKTISGGKTLVDQPGYRVDLFYANGGVETSLADTAAPFSFSNVPMGVHAIRVVQTVNPGAGTVVAQDTIVVRPSTTTAVELWF